jgi:hypothetical protein
MEKFKKGEVVYTIENGLVLPCTIVKISTEDRIKDFKSGAISRKKLFKIATFDPSTSEWIPGAEHLSRYPEKFAFVRFKNGGERWKELDSFKRTASEFINFIN